MTKKKIFIIVGISILLLLLSLGFYMQEEIIVMMTRVAEGFKTFLHVLLAGIFIGAVYGPFLLLISCRK